MFLPVGIGTYSRRIAFLCKTEKDLPRLDMILGMMNSYREECIVSRYCIFPGNKMSIGKKTREREKKITIMTLKLAIRIMGLLKNPTTFWPSGG